MKEVSIDSPVPILQSIEGQSDESFMTLAAFMLAAGARPGKRLRSDASILPDDDLVELGLKSWWNQEFREQKRPRVPEFRSELRMEELSGQDYLGRLNDLLHSAIREPTPTNTMQVVAEGLRSRDDLVRICALYSALELFEISPARLFQRLAWFAGRPLHPTTQELLSMLLNRSPSNGGSTSSQPPITHTPTAQSRPGLILIHGTNFPPDRPVWSVPKVGALFNYIAKRRSDLYGQPDYYRWEGGYSDYAREVAALNLKEWVGQRSFYGLDAVTHSHGGNVLIEATNLGLLFSKVIFLSCPVHWGKYRPPHHSIGVAHSIRIRFDLVILGDRGRQRFPKSSGIKETLLPYWFVKHGSSYDPKNWSTYNFDRFL